MPKTTVSWRFRSVRTIGRRKRQQEFLLALSLDPNDASIYVDLARHFLSEGNRPAAEESIRQARKIDPDSPYLQRFLEDRHMQPP